VINFYEGGKPDLISLAKALPQLPDTANEVRTIANVLLVSHWEVDSETTVRLMIGTFQNAARDPKLSHGEALRNSMLPMIGNANSDDDAHPRIWAPFVVVGGPAKQQ
jgi:CHAT domain-containing protein